MSDGAPLILAADLGTTALKCAIFDSGGGVVAEVTREYRLHSPSPEIVEVPVETYWAEFVAATHELLASPGVDARRVQGIGFSVQGETLILVDENLRPLRPAIVWLDNRATREAEDLASRFPGDVFYSATGQPEMLATWPAAKILWLRRHEPEIFRRTAKFLLLEDYFLARLTGEVVAEGSLLTSTGYWDFRSRDWWPAMLEELQVDRNRLPVIVEPGSPIGTVLPAVAQELGVSGSATVCAGALDQACCAIGGGAVDLGSLSENTGAAVALCAVIDGPRLDPQGEMPCHYHGIPDNYMFHTFTSGGIVLKWFRDEFGSGASYAELSDMAAGVPAGSDGLVMLPHLQGAMAPENNQDARGVFVGISLAHTRPHFVRSLMESITFVVRRNVDAMAAAGVSFDSVRALGGGSRSPIWKQIEADVTGIPVQTTTHADAGTLGAALLTATGLGWFSDVKEASRATVRLDRVFEPNPHLRGLYDDAYGVFRQTYDSLTGVFPRLATLQTDNT